MKEVISRKVFQARFTDALKAKLDAGSHAKNQSLNSYIINLLANSIALRPTLEVTPRLQGDLNQKPFSLRIPELLKTSIQESGRCLGRSLNTEILIRLTLALESQHEPKRIDTSGSAEMSCKEAWHRLSAAIDNTLLSDLLRMPDAISELESARAHYRVVVGC